MAPLLGVEDAAECIFDAWKRSLLVGNQIFNVGSDEQNYQIDEVAQIIGTALGGIPISRDSSNLDARDYRVSFSKLKTALGFSPKQTIGVTAKTIFEKLYSGVIRNPAQRIYYNHYFDSAKNTRRVQANNSLRMNNLEILAALSVFWCKLAMQLGGLMELHLSM
jgi:hypothetical protein